MPDGLGLPFTTGFTRPPDGPITIESRITSRQMRLWSDATTSIAGCTPLSDRLERTPPYDARTGEHRENHDAGDAACFVDGAQPLKNPATDTDSYFGANDTEADTAPNIPSFRYDRERYRSQIVSAILVLKRPATGSNRSHSSGPSDSEHDHSGGS